MSKINRVFLEGWVSSDARVLDEDGKYKAMAIINCIASNRHTGDKDTIIPKASVIIASYNKKNGAQIEPLKENDIVSIKGVLTTMSVEKGKICPMCGEKVMAVGQVCYVSPIRVTKIGHAEDAKEAYQHLKDADVQEVSNEVYLIGNVCSGPKKIETLKSTTAIQYQLAVPRNYRLLETLNEDTDYPWIKAFGSKAEEQLEKLQSGTQVLVNGYLNPRQFYSTKDCPSCGTTFEFPDKTLEIVPYEVEYMRHYKEKGGAAGYMAE
jgi:hypothetical protein